MSAITAAVAPTPDNTFTVVLTGLDLSDLNRLVIQGREYEKDKGFRTTAGVVADALNDALTSRSVR